MVAYSIHQGFEGFEQQAGWPDLGQVLTAAAAPCRDRLATRRCCARAGQWPHLLGHLGVCFFEV